MKKLIIAVLALTGFSVVSFAQVAPTLKKTTPAKMQVVKKQNEVMAPTKVVALNKAKTTTPMPVVAKTTPVKAPVKTVVAVKPVASSTTKSVTHLKKDGTADKRFTAHAASAKVITKKDGTADMRYKANKKHI